MDDTLSSIGTIASPVKLNSKLSGFKILCKLGEGSFSIVYKVQRFADNKIYAMKKVLMGRLNEKEKGNALNEIRILASIKNDHIIEYRESFFDEQSNTLCIIMEYADQGDLLQKLIEYKQANKVLRENNDHNFEQKQKINDNILLKKKESNLFSNSKISRSYQDNNEDEDLKVLQTSFKYKDQQLIQQSQEQQAKFIYIEEELIWDYLLQCLKGLKCLHDMKILHRDLKLANIFIGAHNIIKIGDLNVSKVTQCADLMAQTQIGTPQYTAPEVWQGLEYNHKSDVWSIGCIIYELCAQKHPFCGHTIEGLLASIMKGQYQRIPEFYSDELAYVISLCLQLPPNQRLSCNELLELPCFQSRKSRYEEKYKPFLFTHQKYDQKQKYQISDILELIEQNNFSDAEKNHFDFTPERYTHKDSVFLIDTIQLPSNMKQLSSLLPQPNYDHNIILPSQITKFDENILSNHIPQKIKIEKKSSIEKASEFQQIDEIVSVRSSLSSGSIKNDGQEMNHISIKKDQRDCLFTSENKFQNLIDKETEQIFQLPYIKLQQICQEKSIEQRINQKQNSQNQNCHNQSNNLKFDNNSSIEYFDNQSRKQNHQEIQNEDFNDRNKSNQIELNQIDFIKYNKNRQLRSISEQKNQKFIKIQQFQNDDNQTKNYNSQPNQQSLCQEDENKPQKHIFLQKVEFTEYKNFSGLTLTNDTKNTIQSKNSIQTKNSKNKKTYEAFKYNGSDSNEETLQNSQNENINIQNLQQRQKLIECNLKKNIKNDPMPLHQQSLKFNQKIPLLKYRKSQKNKVSDLYFQEVQQAKQNLSINQYKNQIDNQTNQRVIALKFKFKKSSGQQQAIFIQNGLQQQIQKQFNTLINDTHEFRNYPTKHIQQNFQDKLQNEHIFSGEEDFSYYSPTMQERDFAVPKSTVANCTRQQVNKKISSASKQRQPPSLQKYDKNISPLQRNQKSPYIMTKYLPQIKQKNRYLISEKNNRSIHEPLIQRSSTQETKLRNRSLIKYPPVLNQVKYHYQNSFRIPTNNGSMHYQLNNKSQNNSDDLSLVNISSKYTNYSLCMQNDSNSTPPSIRNNNKSLNSVNILNNSFGNKQQHIRQNQSQDNNHIKIQNEKSIQPQNNNRIQVPRQIKNNQKSINTLNYNLNPSSPKKIAKKLLQNRRNIFQISNNIRNQQINFSYNNNLKQNKSNLTYNLDRSFYEASSILEEKLNYK